jgi:hypothetical protein
MNEDILSQISYLDDFDESAGPATRSPERLEAFMLYLIQREIARRQIGEPGRVSARVASLESQVKQMQRTMRIMASQRGRPSVQYVLVSHTKGEISLAGVPTAPNPQKARVPRAMVFFYGAGLVCSLTFSVFLALSAIGVTPIHPFLSLLGLIGGLGWLTTAWTDLLLWKRERVLDESSSIKTTTE